MAWQLLQNVLETTLFLNHPCKALCYAMLYYTNSCFVFVFLKAEAEKEYKGQKNTDSDKLKNLNLAEYVSYILHLIFIGMLL